MARWRVKEPRPGVRAARLDVKGCWWAWTGTSGMVAFERVRRIGVQAADMPALLEAIRETERVLRGARPKPVPKPRGYKSLADRIREYLLHERRPVSARNLAAALDATVPILRATAYQLVYRGLVGRSLEGDENTPNLWLEDGRSSFWTLEGPLLSKWEKMKGAELTERDRAEIQARCRVLAQDKLATIDAATEARLAKKRAADARREDEEWRAKNRR